MSPSLAVDAEQVRLAVYRGFATTGRAPTPDELAAGLEVAAADVERAITTLAASRHVVVGEGGEIVMAHPFASVPLGFSVMGRRTLWWGGCAWDSFALPHLLRDEPDVLVATRCPGCGSPLSWVVGRRSPPPGDEVAHFLVPARHMWDDVVDTCAHQRLFCGRGCVEVWLGRAGRRGGYVMDLATLWALASDWYTGRLDRGYVRRDPSQAREYFRNVGLRGDFWGL